MALTAGLSAGTVRGERGSFATRLTEIASVVAFLLGTLRIFTLVLHFPVLGYANNFDMVRTQACIQVWPADPTVPPGIATFEAPLDRYQVRDVPEARDHCVPSSDLVFAYLGRLVARAAGGSSFSIRVIGALRASALAILACGFLLHLLRRATPTEAFLHALVYLVVLSDPANTLYANTFYREFSALFFAYGALLMLWSVCRLGEGAFTVPALAGSLLLLGLSNRQHILLPFAVLTGLLLAAGLQRRPLRRALAFAFLAGLLSASFHGVSQLLFAGPGSYLETIDRANATDTFLGAVLPAADDPVEAARILGLPPRCVEHGGKTWYSPGVQEDHPCSEVFDVSRLRIALLALEQPGFVVRVTREGTIRLRPWALRHLGSVGGLQFGYAGRVFWTLSDVIDLVPNRALTSLFLFPAVLGLVAVVASVFKRGDPRRQGGAAVVVAVVLSAYSVFYSSLFGDGTQDFQKHTHLFTSLVLSLLVVSAVVSLKVAASILRGVLAGTRAQGPAPG